MAGLGLSGRGASSAPSSSFSRVRPCLPSSLCARLAPTLSPLSFSLFSLTHTHSPNPRPSPPPSLPSLPSLPSFPCCPHRHPGPDVARRRSPALPPPLRRCPRPLPLPLALARRRRRHPSRPRCQQQQQQRQQRRPGRVGQGRGQELGGAGRCAAGEAGPGIADGQPCGQRRRGAWGPCAALAKGRGW